MKNTVAMLVVGAVVISAATAFSFPVDTKNFYWKTGTATTPAGAQESTISATAWCNPGDEVITGSCWLTGSYGERWLIEEGELYSGSNQGWLCAYPDDVSWGIATVTAGVKCVHP